mmetsp:Transcript_50769/g.94930  ORF Transcript_50769/g.94930 Transcript_50769/m.94930 type:complete len:237 (+) Transcript_50769:970-1680(+)
MPLTSVAACRSHVIKWICGMPFFQKRQSALIPTVQSVDVEVRGKVTQVFLQYRGEREISGAQGQLESVRRATASTSTCSVWTGVRTPGTPAADLVRNSRPRDPKAMQAVPTRVLRFHGSLDFQLWESLEELLSIPTTTQWAKGERREGQCPYMHDRSTRSLNASGLSGRSACRKRQARSAPSFPGCSSCAESALPDANQAERVLLFVWLCTVRKHPVPAMVSPCSDYVPRMRFGRM